MCRKVMMENDLWQPAASGEKLARFMHQVRGGRRRELGVRHEALILNMSAAGRLLMQTVLLQRVTKPQLP